MIGKRVFLGSTYRNFKDASSLRSEIANYLKSRLLAASLKYNNKGEYEKNFVDGDDFDFGHVSLECGNPR
jgi:hypothetical protein